MPWFAYVIKSEKDGRLYKGMAKNIALRLPTHNKGKVSSTKAYRPWSLVYFEECRDSLHAREREILEIIFWQAFSKITRALTTDHKGWGFLPALRYPAPASRESLQ